MALSSDISLNLELLQCPETFNSVAYGNSVFVAVALSGIYSSSDGSTWTKVFTNTIYSFYGVDFVNNEFIATGWVGGNGYSIGALVCTSSNGTNWTPNRVTNQDVTSGFIKCIYGAGVYLAITIATTLFLSTDFVNWTNVNLTSFGLGSGVQNIIYANGQFMLVGVSGILLTSANGTSWTQNTSDPVIAALISSHTNLFCIAWDGSQYLIGGDAGTIITSPTGVTWTLQTGGDLANDGPSGNNTKVWQIVPGGSTYLAIVSSTVSVSVLMSTNSGVAWYNQNCLGLGANTSNSTVISDVLSPAIYGDGTFVISCSTVLVNTTNGTVYTNAVSTPLTPNTQLIQYQSGSTFFTFSLVITSLNSSGMYDGFFNYIDLFLISTNNGVTWTCYNMYTSVAGKTNTTYVVWLNGQFVAVGNGGLIATSPTGVTWTQQTSGVTTNLSCVTYGDSLYVAVGSGGSTNILYSSNSTSWTTVSNSATFYYVAYLNLLFIGLCSTGIYTSSNGTTWTSRLSHSATWKSVVYDGTDFIAGGRSGITPEIATSTTGTSWTVTTPTATIPDGVSELIVFGSITIAVGPAAIAYTSNHGSTWTNTFASAVSVAASSSLLLAVNTGGQDSHFLTSTTGETWYCQGIVNGITDIAYGDFVYVAVGTNAIQTSSDGITWSSQIYIAAAFRNIIYSNSQFVAIAGNDIFISTNGTTWSVTTISTSITQGLYAVAGNGSGTYVAVGYNSGEDGGVILTSVNNGSTWAAQTNPDPNFGVPLTNVVYVDGNFLIVNSTGTDYLLSSNGTTWTDNTFPTLGGSTAYATGSCICNGQFATTVVGGGAIAQSSNCDYGPLFSTDGTSWTTTTTEIGGYSILNSGASYTVLQTNNDYYVSIGIDGLYHVAQDQQTFHLVGAGLINCNVVRLVNGTIYAVGGPIFIMH